MLPVVGRAQTLRVDSPNGRLGISLRIPDNGRPTFAVNQREREMLRGTLGLRLSGALPLQQSFQVAEIRRAKRDSTYPIAVGKTSSARDHHNELLVSLRETKAPLRKLDLILRAFDDGVAFRYRIPQQDGVDEFILLDELTCFTFAGNPTARLLPLNSHTTSYEQYYKSLRVADIDAGTLIGLPLLLEYSDEDHGTTWLAVTEAHLTDYAGMYLAAVAGERATFATKLSPLPGRLNKAKVQGRAPHVSPWRVLMIADDPGRLIESNIVFHLSDPPAIKDTAWIKPGKTTFPWWNGYYLAGVDFEPGLNTATHKHYIDFCAEQGNEYHSLDGTDIAWYGGPIIPNGPTDITTAVPEIDLPELLRYAQEKGVRLRLWMHWKALRRQVDEAFKLYESWGIEGVMVDFMDRDDQEMVAFYHEVAGKAARHHLTVTWHGAYKPTGMERTWPNVLTYEAALNQETNKWDPRGTPAEHNLDVAFVRMLAGPVDYHHGGMRNVLSANYKPKYSPPPVQGTRAHQLAMYVVYQNHLPMLVDYPAAYRGQPGLEFLTEVPTNWDETCVLHADFGKSLVTARRRGSVWYLGGMSVEEQDLDLSLRRLGTGPWNADMYLDDEANGPTGVIHERRRISPSDHVRIRVSAGGGFVAKLTAM